MKETTQKKPVIQAKKIVRILLLAAFALCFMPTCLVSCSGQSRAYGLLDGISGYSSDMELYEMSGGVTPKPQWQMILVFVIPLVLLALTWLKNLPERKIAVGSAVGVLVDLILWTRFQSYVKNLAESMYCEFKSTGWYGINLTVLTVLLLILILIALGILSMDGTLFAFGSAQAPLPHRQNRFTAQPAYPASHINAQRPSPPFGAVSGTIIGYCAKCGAPLKAGARFCGACGSRIVDETAKQAELAAQAAAEQARREDTARQAAEEQAQREDTARQAAEEQARREDTARQAAIVETPQELMQEGSDLKDTETSAVPQVLYCSECGAKLTPDARFCPECGTPTDE